MKKILLISGHKCSGKSRLARNLRGKSGFFRVRTSSYLKKQITTDQLAPGRADLRKRGEQLESETSGAWIVEPIEQAIEKTLGTHSNPYVVVDCVTTWDQVSEVRKRYGLRVVHVHLDAPVEVLAQRYGEKYREELQGDTGEEFADASPLALSEEEKLRREADLVINTKESSDDDTYVRVGSRLELFAPPTVRCVDVLVGGQYGSEGKGQIAAYLAANYDVLVRVGGPNAGHKVKSNSGKYVYHHLPSGCRDTQAEVLIGPGAVVNPENLLQEIKECGLTKGRIFIDPQVMIISKEDIDTERAGIVGDIGSTGSGTGFAAARKIAGRGSPNTLLARDCENLKPYLGSTYERLESAYARGKRVLLEGTQGSLLSIHHGIYPYVTSRDTNVAGCLAEAGISPARVRKIIMVVRSYPIRVANPDGDGKTSGYMKSEIDFATVAKRSGVSEEEIAYTEKTSTTNRTRRIGEFDWYFFRKACALNAPTDIVLTFADYISKNNHDAHRYEQLTPETIQFIEELERVSHAPVSLISTRFDPRAVIDRRDWW